MKKVIRHKSEGFTLIEILVVIGIIAILAGVVLVAVNPSRQFKMARDSQRVSNVNTLLNAIGQNIAEHQGKLVCAGSIMQLPAVPSTIRNRNDDDPATYQGDLIRCLIPDYLTSLPFDPTAQNAHFGTLDDYDTGYNVSIDSSGRVTVSAHPELASSISVSR